MNLEPEEVEDERQDDQTHGTGSKVLAKLGEADGAARSVDIEELPEINSNSRTNGDKGKDTDVLDRDIAGEGETGKNQPLPPLLGEGVVSQLVELDVKE